MKRFAPLSALALGAWVLFANPVPGRADPSADAWRRQGQAAVQRALDRSPLSRPARNVILFIGDGMGVSTVTAARIFEGQLRGQPGEENTLAFERLPHVALVKTYNTNQQVADSAGTATAMLTGVKTRAGVINLSPSAPRGRPADAALRLRTLFEEAKARGVGTGIVSTARITHATPAAAYAHTSERDWESDADLSDEAQAAGVRDIARQLVEFANGSGLDVILGGGRAQFLPNTTADPEYPEKKGARKDGENLIESWRAGGKDRHFVWNREQLTTLSPTEPGALFGLFEPSHMQFEAQRPRDGAGEPSLAEMTGVAIERLAQGDEGYVLLVEAGRIDHGHHASSAFLALHDTIAFSNAVATAVQRVDLSETLIVVTADHSHVFTVAGYPTRGNPILGLVHGNDVHGEPQTEPAKDASGLPYTTLGYANGPGYPGASDSQPEGPKQLPHFPRKAEGVTKGRPDLGEVDTMHPRYLQESAVPLIAETHAGEDVPLYADGPGAALFHGVREQSYVYHAIHAALGWNEPKPQ
ncbi:MAG: alkaline phosphatase [Myxococcota bacterium]